jgi:hypothetical protein
MFDEAVMELKRGIVDASNLHVPSFQRMTETANEICIRHGTSEMPMYHPLSIVGPIVIGTVHMTLFDAFENFILMWQRAICLPRFPAPGMDLEKRIFGTEAGKTLMDTVFHMLQLLKQVPHARIWRVLSLLLCCTPSSPWLYYETEAKRVAMSSIARVFPQLSALAQPDDYSLREAVSRIVWHAGPYLSSARTEYNLNMLQ